MYVIFALCEMTNEYILMPDVCLVPASC